MCCMQMIVFAAASCSVVDIWLCHADMSLKHITRVAVMWCAAQSTSKCMCSSTRYCPFGACHQSTRLDSTGAVKCYQLPTMFMHKQVTTKYLMSVSCACDQHPGSVDEHCRVCVASERQTACGRYLTCSCCCRRDGVGKINMIEPLPLSPGKHTPIAAPGSTVRRNNASHMHNKAVASPPELHIWVHQDGQ